MPSLAPVARVVSSTTPSIGFSDLHARREDEFVAEAKFRNRPISRTPPLLSLANMARHDIDRWLLGERV
jgi:hypothetical protein